jgi:exonuclease SbcD
VTRLLCLGDTHIGSGSVYDDRLADSAAMFEQVVAIAREREVDGVLLAGDIFDKPRPAPAELHVFADFLRRLERAAIPSVACLGNVGHDQSAANSPTALELFSFGDWMRVSRHPEVLPLGGIQVCTLPNAPTSRLTAARGTRDDVNELSVKFLLEEAARLRAEAEGPAVLLGHWSVGDASLPNGLPTSDLHEPVLPLFPLEALGFDAIVMGHIHKPQILNTAPRPILYTGSPLCLNFGEADVEHGVWIAGVGEELFSAEFVPLDGRRYVTVDVDLTDPPNGSGDDATDVIAGAITLPIADAIVRIRYRCSEAQARRVDVHAGRRRDVGAARRFGGVVRRERPLPR